MKYLYSPRFTVGMVSDAYHDNYDATFGRKDPDAETRAAMEELEAGGGEVASWPPRFGCSWCDDVGELGPPTDRFACVCPAARVRELEAKIAALITKAGA